MNESGELEVVILGCGSSGGVPRGDGDWGDCDPAEPRNRRTRCSMLARRHGPSGETNVVIDTSPDFRQQMLAAQVRHVDAILYTHDHADQTHGIDDLRVFATHARRRIPAWMDAATHHALTRRFDYIFESRHGYPAIVEAHRIPPHGPACRCRPAPRSARPCRIADVGTSLPMSVWCWISWPKFEAGARSRPTG